MKLVFCLLLILPVVWGFDCYPNPVVSCSGHGTCVNNGTYGFYCDCDSLWDNRDCPEGVQCCHELLSRTPVFLAAFFGGFTGAPYFLIGEEGLAAGILVMFLGGLFGLCIGACFSAVHPGVGGFITAVSGLSLFASEIWHLALWIMVAAETGKFDTTKVAPW